MNKQTEALKLALETLKQIDEAMPFPVAKLAQKVIREALAEQPAQQQEPEYKGWYCTHCQRGVDGSEVTYHEQHTVCGRVITDDLPPSWDSFFGNAEQPAQQQVFPACRGMNCGCTDGTSHSPECQAEHAAAIAGGVFVKTARQQEPVAWKDEQGNVRMTLDAGEIQSSVGYVYSVHGERIKNACIRSDIPNGTPLYTSPQPAQQELEELTAQRDQLADILTRTANALKGQPAELSSHSWHDLPEVAQQIKAAQQQQEPVDSDPSPLFAHRLALMLECALLDPNGAWDEAHKTLDEYRAAVQRWHEAEGEPHVSPFGKD